MNHRGNDLTGRGRIDDAIHTVTVGRAGPAEIRRARLAVARNAMAHHAGGQPSTDTPDAARDDCRRLLHMLGLLTDPAPRRRRRRPRPADTTPDNQEGR